MMTLREAGRVGLAVVRVMRDSELTSEIHVTEEITGRARFSDILREVEQTQEGRDLLRDRPELCSAQVDYEALRALSPDTLGGAYVRHLDDNGLTADSQAADTHWVPDPQMAYLMRRFRQTHDVWHALTGLGTNGHEEVIIHAFSWGQLRLPVSAMVVFFGTLKHILGEARWPALRHGLHEAYDNGRRADNLLPVYWERYWEEPLQSIRERFAVRACTPAFVT